MPSAKRRAKYKAAGLCANCGVRAPKPGNTLCTECLRSHVSERRRYKQDAFTIISSKYGGEIRCNVRVCPTGGSIDSVELDHIHDDGTEHRGITRGSGSPTHLWIRRNPEEAKKIFQFLCSYHNANKRELRPDDFRVYEGNHEP